jgi:6-phosphogluconolactonase (cycloisomerase 2 family)
VTKTTDAGFATPPNGALTFLVNTSTGGSATTVLVLPVGGFLYATDFDHGSVLAFSISASGALTSSGTLNTGGINPYGLAMTH